MFFYHIFTVGRPRTRKMLHLLLFAGGQWAGIWILPFKMTCTMLAPMSRTDSLRRGMGLRAMMGLIALVVLQAGGCLTPAGTQRPFPRVILNGAPDEIMAEAVASARADILAGRPMICQAGGRDPWPVGIRMSDRRLVARLPVWRLDSDCSSPWLHSARLFAEAYNREIFLHVAGKSGANGRTAGEMSNDRQ